MRVLLCLFILLQADALMGGTYETVDGRRLPLKTVSGGLHKREGHLGPGGNLRWADLGEGSLIRANLSFADLRNANLDHSDLTGAHCNNITLGGASLVGANLLRARFCDSQLDGVDLRGVKNWQTANWKNAYYTIGSEPNWPKGMDSRKAGIVAKKGT